jgi:hypothetical protein
MAAAGAMLTAIFSHAADRCGLTERQCEFKSFVIIAAKNQTGSRGKIADRERTGRTRRDSAKFFEMRWPGTELNRRRQTILENFVPSFPVGGALFDRKMRLPTVQRREVGLVCHLLR